MSEKFENIKNQVNRLAKAINAPDNLLPTYGNSDESRPNIELSDTGVLSYEFYERGQLIDITFALDQEHLLFLIFRDVTFQMASIKSAQHSDPTIDSRRIIFNYQLELLGKLDTSWQTKQKEIQKGLEIQTPFEDKEGQRQLFLQELLGNGFLYSEAINKVNKKYP